MTYHFNDTMKPRQQWATEIRAKMDRDGITVTELAKTLRALYPNGKNGYRKETVSTWLQGAVEADNMKKIDSIIYNWE